MKFLKTFSFSLFLGCMLFSSSPGTVEEIAEGVTEGIIDQIEEYVQQKDKKK